jgi:hypothetical protein
MRGKKANVIDIIEENSKTKQNECVSYEKRKKSGKKKKYNCPCSSNKGVPEYEFFLLPFHQIKQYSCQN